MLAKHGRGVCYALPCTVVLCASIETQPNVALLLAAGPTPCLSLCWPAANGWEGFVLRGFASLLASPARPPVLAVEWNPAAMKAAGWKRPLKLLEWCVKTFGGACNGVGVCRLPAYSLAVLLELGTRAGALLGTRREA